ncbi:MAG: hypothetical protein CMI90_06475 [Pelagibacteraceae bacterium]|nr:hypothetical protein [Pelagibacteraceae bacterium]
MELIVLNPITYIALAAVVLIGLPHGSLDGAIASYLGFNSLYNFFKFLVFYIISSIGVIYLWFFFPVVSLILFLLISIYHFGSCDSNNVRNGIVKFIVIVSHGGSVICATIFFQKETSFIIFEYLSGSNVYLVSSYISNSFYIIVIFVCFYFLICIKEKKYFKKFIEIPIILLLAFYLHPLVTFSIYFCLIHTPRHVLDIIKNISNDKNYKIIIYTTIIFTILTWVFGLIGYLYLLPNLGNSESILKVIFIGLAALTLPHMILVDGFYKPKTKN